MVFLVGFALRLGWVLLWRNEQFIGDYIWLDDRAQDLAAGKGYTQGNGQPTAFWPIGYPLTLSLFYRVFGMHDLVGKLANVAFSMGILAGTFALGRKIFSETTARVGLLLLAISLNSIAYNSLLATETIFTMLFVAALVVVFSQSQHRTTGLLLGAILGITANIKPVTIGLFPFLFLCLWAAGRDGKKAAIHTVVAVLLTIALLIPWLVRNHQRFGKWVLSNEAGLVLLVGANPEATGQYYPASIVQELYPKLQQGGMDEYHGNQECQRLAVQYIREHPLDWFALGFKKLCHMYKHDVDGVWHTLNGVTPKMSSFVWNTLTRTGHAYYGVLMLLVIGYLVQSVARNQLFTIPNLCLLFVFYFSLVCFCFHGLPRYHYPLMPIFCLFAGRFVESLLGRSGGVTSTQQP